MKGFLITLIALFIVAWFFNYPLLSRQFDMESCMAQIKFWHWREIVYKFMFLALGIISFLRTDGVVKALTCFVLILILGDLVDKLIFGITDYVYGDIVLIIVGIIVSYFVYGRSRSLGSIQKRTG